MDHEDDGRPTKRQRLETKQSPQITLADLFLSLPSLLLHPPTHTNHERSLALSYNALKICNFMTSLDQTIECRAATALAEVGLQIGLSSSGIEDEIQKVITKGALIAQNLPSLRLYRHRLAQLSAQLSLFAGNPKVAQTNLKRALVSMTPSDLPHIRYTFHLALIASISSQSADETTNIMRSLGAINDLHKAAQKWNHRPIIQLASLLRLRAFMRSGLWNDVEDALEAAESALDMVEGLKDHRDSKGKIPSPPSGSDDKSSRTMFEYALIIHTLILGIVFQTYVGDSNSVDPRLKWLHELLDIQLSKLPKTGIFEISFIVGPPLYCQLTHPRVVYVLGFLVSSLAKRDLIGRKPKKRVFAMEGIVAVDKELKKELAFTTWSSISDVKDTDIRLKKLRADLMCELIGASVMRSEFDEAERVINETIAYTRTHGIFSAYVARLTLHEAQLAHALNKASRALQCYQIATWLSRKRTSKNAHATNSRVANEEIVDGEEDPWLNAAGRAGELWLRIGLLRQQSSTPLPEEEREIELNKLRKTAESVTKDCRGLGGTLEAVADVLDSCLTKEFGKAKTFLRRAMNLSTNAQDNHLRALVLSLIGSHYLHTSNQHAEKMLETADSLAAGLGAQSKSTKPGLGGSLVPGAGPGSSVSPETLVAGNVHFRLWIGERFLELYNRAGNKEAAKLQAVKNKSFEDAVRKLEAWGWN